MKVGTLSGAGMTEKAARVYLATLALGTTSVQEIAQKTGLKRPTVYLHVDDLLRQGYFEKVSVNKRHYYRAANPRKVEARLQKSLIEFQAALPEFETLQAHSPGKPRVTVYEGEEGVRSVYHEVKTANSFRVWSDVGTSYGPFHDVYMELSESVRTNGIGVREIVADSKASKRYSRLIARECGPTYSARIAAVSGLANDAIIYGSVVALFRLSEHNTFVVRIEDKTIADSMKVLFDMAWKSAKAFR